MIGFKKLAPLCHPIYRSKPKPILSLPSRQLHVSASSLDWFTELARVTMVLSHAHLETALLTYGITSFPLTSVKILYISQERHLGRYWYSYLSRAPEGYGVLVHLSWVLKAEHSHG